MRNQTRKRLTAEQAGIEARLEHLYPVKALIERLFGNAAFMKIKMGGSMREWRQASTKLLDAIDVSVKSTVKIADEDWFEEIRQTIGRGKARIHDAERVDELLSLLVQALAELVFIQLGNFPLHPSHRTTPLTPDWWTLTGFRSVQYVQTTGQREAQARLGERRAENRRKVVVGD